MATDERIAQLERDVKSLQECNDAAHREIAILRDEFVPWVERILNEKLAPLEPRIRAQEVQNIGNFFMGRRPAEEHPDPAVVDALVSQINAAD